MTKTEIEGIQGKILSFFMSLYKNVRVWNKHQGIFTDTLSISEGVFPAILFLGRIPLEMFRKQTKLLI